MAADPSLDWVTALPWAWGYGITRAGRVFFINEEAKSTTWLHPVTGEAVLTGHRKTADLPTGWEEGYTFEGARYYINHNERKVTCKHPVTAQPSQDNCIFVVNDQTSSTMTSQENKDRSVSMTSDASNGNTVPSGHPTSPVTRSSRTSGKVHNFGKRSNSIKRNPNAPVILRSWLYKKANSGMKLWKKRWFVLSDLCLFYYRDEKEEGVLGSILLPSFQISTITPEDHINRMFAFKEAIHKPMATHSNMRTYYFCTDTAKEMELWMKAMSDASLLHSEPSKRTDNSKAENPTLQEMNHVANHKLLIRPEANNNQKNREINKMEEKKAREAERYGFQKDGPDTRPLTKINSVRHPYSVSDYEILAASTAQYRAIQVNGPEEHHHAEMDNVDHPRGSEPERAMQRTSSLLQLEQWIRAQRERSTEDDARGVMSYQTLPRNMPSYRAQVVPRYPEGYRTLPRNLKPRPESLCSTTGMGYERTMVPLTATTEDKRRSIRDDTMWQLYEWQQRQFYNKQTTLRRHGSLTSPKTMVHISEQALHSIPLSPSHGSISGYHTYSPHRAYRSEVSSPVQRGDFTMDRKQKSHPSKHAAYTPDRRSMPAGLPLPPITPQGLQGKSMTQDDCRSTVYKYRSDEVDIDARLSRLCEQDKVVQALEKKLQQLHKEKYTLEQALLSASQEIEMNTDNPAAIQSVMLQRDDLQNGLLSTCREVSRATAELERAWKDYDKLEHDVTATRNQMREQLERLGEVQTESAGIQRAQMQKEIWRIQDVMEGLSKNKQQRRSTEPAGNSDSNLFSSGLSTSEGPDYRLYKSEPELTTVAEVDEANVDDKADHSLDPESSANKGPHFPVGVVPPRSKSPPLESTTIASYVTLRKTKKERPRSAVEHLCIAESPRPRMTVEEQLERMRRHQQACLKEKKRGLSFIGSSDQSLAQSPSVSRENSLKMTQVRKREEKFLSNIKDLENAVRESNPEQRHETPAQEITRLKETVTAEESRGAPCDETEDLEAGKRFAPKTKEAAAEAVAEQRDPVVALQALVETSLEVVSVTTLKSESSQSENPNNEPERTGILFSYEFSAEALRRHTSLEAGGLSSLQEPPTLPAGPAQPQLTEGSHFMCV